MVYYGLFLLNRTNSILALEIIVLELYTKENTEENIEPPPPNRAGNRFEPRNKCGGAMAADTAVK